MKQHEPATDHSADSTIVSYGLVFANVPASAEIQKANPKFPVGAILVRERNDAGTDETPEAIIAMVKRAGGFSKKTDDWEFLVLNGNDLKLRSRETIGSCADCHVRAQKTDWVFWEHLK